MTSPSVPTTAAHNAPGFALSAASTQRATGVARVGALCLAIGAGTILALASSLTPSPEGHATHLALGLPPCGWVVSFGRPCPTCGMTTAFAHVAHGQLLAAFVTQPFGAVLACVMGIVGWGALHVAATGSMLGHAVAQMLTRRVVWSLVAFFVASWIYKILTFNLT
ncbi:MAG: DUF2752 domain-containing protein [Planctomycetota bacterium]|nr:DUF2752 domain-containing protein [Planctomycetota bacterium]